MATASSRDKDDLLLESVARLGIGIRELWKSALGFDPNNIINRLVGKGLLQPVTRGLPQNRAYYLRSGEKALGGQALQQRLAVAWYVLMETSTCTVRVTDAEMQSLLGNQVPSGVHLLQAVAGEGPRLLHVYAPETIEVVPGILRHAERVLTFPRVKHACSRRQYALLVLVPWATGMEKALQETLAPARGVAPASTVVTARQCQQLRELNKDIGILVERTATPMTLGLALKEKGGENA